MNDIDSEINRLQKMLLKESNENGFWAGELNSSALSTATAVFALAAVNKEKYASNIRQGMNWLIKYQNPDGGWGDTEISKSNLSTTLLVYSAMSAADPGTAALNSCKSFIKKLTGSLEPENIVKSILNIYGSDRTFSIPILTTCALAGRLGKDGWKYVHPLPFELAVFPQQMFKRLQLPVVSYALPALIAIGQVGFYKRPPVNPVSRIIRKLAKSKTLKVLTKIQPENGGFLEATPLTSFVVLSLANCGHKDHVVSKNGAEFLIKSQRKDGSWPIDTNLATWLTTMSVQAQGKDSMGDAQKKNILTWLINQQHRKVHPYTKADPGGWAWTDLPGGVPDADDTPGALLALKKLDPNGEQSRDAAEAAVSWLIKLQNLDGGIPTFCKGWGRLPFDKSCTDLTAHALSAWSAWKPHMKPSQQKVIDRSIQKGLIFLHSAQRADGSWVPLWFGNEHVKDITNPVYGTAKVLIHTARMKQEELTPIKKSIRDGIKWLIKVQKKDGTWGGDAEAPSSIEETALALDAMAGYAVPGSLFEDHADQIQASITKGTEALIEIIKEKDTLPAAPIGLYFASLWYYEKLYPLIFSLSALRKVKQVINKRRIS